jgi:hypothetical protein
MKANVLLLASVALCLSGCVSIRYRVVQPPMAPAGASVQKQPVNVHYDPLDYRLRQYHERLEMQITNPTEDKLVLLGNRSFVIDPKGESHPIRERVLGPHSFTKLLLPPEPFSYAYPDYWAWGPGWGWGYPGWYGPYYWGPYYGPGWWGPPPLSYYRVLTLYDWEWKKGTARLRLTFEKANKDTFEQDFEIVREEY